MSVDYEWCCDIREISRKKCLSDDYDVLAYMKRGSTYATALKIRELLEALEADWGEAAAEMALAIVTGARR